MQIAVCDNEKEIRDMFAEKIARFYPEADLSLYQSGEELLLSDKEPDILLPDIQMPGKNGMETAKALRRKNKKVIIIFVTALDDFVFQAFDVGAFHYLVRPFLNESLNDDDDYSIPDFWEEYFMRTPMGWYNADSFPIQSLLPCGVVS